MLIKRRILLPSYQKHFFSLVILILCLTAAIGLSCIFHNVTSDNPINTALLFILFLIVVSYCTVGYSYGIIYCLLTVLYFLEQNMIPFNYPVTFLSLLAITIFISTLASHLTSQANIIAEKEKQLSEAEMEKMRANLLRAISHDLRTPLTGILGNSVVFLENQAHLSEQEKTAIITNIYEDSNWLINMVENLLSVTRIRDQNLCISTSQEPVEEVVAEVLQKMEKRHPECTVHVRIPEQFLMLPMDAVLIEQVAINLLENALYHSGSSAPIDFIVEDKGGEVAFTVRDYGVGIPAEKLDNLFDGMDHANPHSVDAHKGMGIGLALCKTIITAHHGTLTGGNHQNGAEFTFTLPKIKEETFSQQKGILRS